MQEFVKCLQAYLKGEKLNKIDNDKDLINLAIEQSLQTLLYPVYNDKSYKKYYIGWVVKQEEFLSIQKEITSIFNANNIDHIYTKGSIICLLYDDFCVRTRGDIDVYVSYDNIDKAKSSLTENKFEFTGPSPHDIQMSKNGLSIEVHYCLFDESIDKSWNKYFNNPFDSAIKLNDNLYKLDDTYHLIYCIAHFAKHLRLGAGIRYILDFYYMLKKTKINYDMLHTELNKLKLFKLYTNILNAIYYLTEEVFDICNKQNCEFFIKYMLKSGIHGFGKDNDENLTLGHAKKHKFRFMLYRIFLIEKKYRKLRYPILGAYWYLYPICLLKNWIYLISHRLKEFFKYLFYKDKNKNLYNKLGI